MNSPFRIRALANLLVTCAIVLLASSTAYADCKGHCKDKGHQMPAYAELDANADDVVTAEEFYAFRAKRMSERAAEGRKLKNAQNAPTFEDLDLDGDGNLSAEEFSAHQAQCPMHKKRKGNH
ncbi:MAG: EF-hand domain-containing protein [Woeseiaceae bacterium]|nr:EF-hand domain-containing protein [Woeseiaceae bacterium]